ncbi:MAG: beta-lactamase family protein [Gammaproteobacteria bacterium]|nr:beta-lactamase family protein [Gammaproteobacteria bacterium]
MIKNYLNSLIPVLILSLAIGCSDNNNNSSEPDSNIDTVAIDEKVSELLENSKIPGLSIALVSTKSDTPEFWSKGYGWANIETQTPVDDNTAFWMASVSKAVLGTLIQMANEQGIVNLDSDIRPELSVAANFSIDDPLNRAINLRSLATHTSGIVDTSTYNCAYYLLDENGNAQSLLDAVGVESPLNCDVQGRTSLRDYLYSYLDSEGLYYDSVANFSSTNTFEYSNIGSGLAGLYLELQSGQSLHEFAATQLFTPLGMGHTGWTSESLSGVSIATPHISEGGDTIALPIYELATYPDAGLRSSASDMALFLSLIMNDGLFEGSRLLQSTSIEELTTPSEANSEYGFFFELDTDGGYGHTGEDPGAGTYMFVDPSESAGVVLLANTDFDGADFRVLEELLELLFDSAKAL